MQGIAIPDFRIAIPWRFFFRIAILTILRRFLQERIGRAIPLAIRVVFGEELIRIAGIAIPFPIPTSMVNITVAYQDRQRGDYAEVYSDLSKILEELNWTARYTNLTESLSMAWKWQKQLTCQGETIAHNLRSMFTLKVPGISVIIGEGGSGGALAIGCCNKMLMLKNSVYYVASPEARAAILWKRKDASPMTAEKLRITAKEL